MGAWASDDLQIDDIYEVLNWLSTDPRRAFEATDKSVKLLPAQKNSQLRSFAIVRVRPHKCDDEDVKYHAFIAQKLIGEVALEGKRWRPIRALMLTYHSSEMTPPRRDQDYQITYEDVDLLRYARCFQFIE